ncbi:MAG: LysR family transcriptional regulator [Polyangiaceae bacterium]|nr:LysR family transcriptional regulator [Polyangiaceae bacterium]
MLLDEIESFVRVVEAGSFTRAAKQLGVPKSTLSRALSRLEDATRVRLLRRSTRAIALTEAGRRFFDQVSSHVGSLRTAMDQLTEEEDKPQGVLRVTMPVDVGEALMADVIARFTDRYPGVTVEADASGRMVNLVEEGFDVAIRAAHKLKDSSMVARKLFKTEIVLYASPDYIAKNGAPRTVEDLARHDVAIFHPPGTKTDTLGLKSIVTPPRFVATDFCFIRSLLVGGAVVGPLPTISAQRAVDDGTLVRVVPEWSMFGGWLYVLYPSSPHVPKKVTAFRDFVIEELARPEVDHGAAI